MFKKLVATIATIASLTFAGEHWNVDLGGVSMKFLSMQVSARSAAMSGAGVADSKGASEISRNPLAMNAVEKAEIGVNQLIFGNHASDHFTEAYYGLPFELFSKPLTLGFAGEFLGYDEIEGRDDEGFKTSDYGAYAWALQAGLGSRNKAFNWAISMRFSQQTIDDESAIAILGDVGGSYRVNKYFAFATTLTNFGYMGDYNGESESEPMALTAGVTAIIPVISNWNVHLSADAYRRADTDAYWLFGGEINYLETLALRVGYAIRPDTDDDVSCGIGIIFGMFTFDYGYSPKPAFDGGYHYLTLGLKF